MRVDIENLKKAAEEIDKEASDLYLAREKLIKWYDKCVRHLLEDVGCKDQFTDIVDNDILAPLSNIVKILGGHK